MKINKNTKKYLKHLLVFLFLFLSLSAFLSGCGLTPPKSMIPPTYVKPTAQNGGIKSKPVLGSLWDGSDNGTNLYSDNIAYKLNDIVTIIVNNQTQVNNSSGTVLSHNSSGLGSIAFGTLSTAKPTGYNGSNDETFNGGGGVAESGQISSTIEAQVVKVFPNGNVELKGESNISVNGETSYLLIKGIVRPIDISPANTVLSSQIANARIWINGKGYVNSSQSPNWLYKIMQDIWPF
ncbi:MAG: flagellar basal body L-ring protein FlgH [bacterium]